jgi:hypothetical protein
MRQMPFVSPDFTPTLDITTSNMRIKRRSFIHLLMALGPAYVLRSLWLEAFAMPAKEHDPFRALAPYLDTLIPEDQTPSATQLGVDRDLLEYVEGKRLLRALLQEGCIYLDKMAQTGGVNSFAELDEDAREDIVRLTDEAPRDRISGFFFNFVRDRAFKIYYAHPQSWVGLGIDSTPQPLGYPDYVQAPNFVR